MISHLEIDNIGPITHFDSGKLGKINLFIGHNGMGKTTILKLLYATVKSIEQNGRGRNKMKNFNELLAEKLVNTFDTDDIGKIVRQKSPGKAVVKVTHSNQICTYTFSNAAKKQIAYNNVNNTFPPMSTNSVFIPAKEVLAIQKPILSSREREEFGFDDTYYDVARALEPTKKGRNYKEFASARNMLSEAIGGRIEYDAERNEWIFKDKNKRAFDIALTSEGIKKLSIIDSLLGSHYLSEDSIVFIDEPESALHPEMISKFMDIVMTLSKRGLQFFIASHSYFVIKKLYLLAHQEKVSIPVFSIDEKLTRSDLKEEMPDNPIIAESVRLYREEIDL